MAGKRNCSLFCAPMPIARFIQIFPKLAIVFFVIHVTVMIYSFLSPSPHAAESKEGPPGVVDPKMKHFVAEYEQRIHSDLKNKTINMKNNTTLRREKSKSLILHGLGLDSHNNIKGRDDKKRPGDLKKYPGR